MPNYDSKENIINFKAYDYFGHLLEIATRNENGVGKTILNLSGLSERVKDAFYFLDPFSYNGEWQNKNAHYNPIQYFLNLYPDLDDEHKFLFLKNIIEKVDLEIHLDNTKKLDNYLSLFGYKLIEKKELTTKGYSIDKANIGFLNREEDISVLGRTILSNHPKSFRFLDEAVSTFGNAEYKSCIDNVRSLFESIVNDLGKDSFQNNLLSKSGERVVDKRGNELRNQKKIFTYWIKENKGANRYRLFSTVYSALSGLGIHGESVPTKKDALMFLRIVEDILVWMLI